MYLSRSKTLSLWPELEDDQKSKKFLSFDGVKSSVSLSLIPKIDVTAEWKKEKPQAENKLEKIKNWPPWNSIEIAAAIERFLRSQHSVGSLSDFTSRKFAYCCYKLAGRLFLDIKSRRRFHFRGSPILLHSFSGRICLAGTDIDIGVQLSIESISGINRRGEQWEVEASGANYMLIQATAGQGYPLFGLFTHEGHHPNLFATAGIVYFASANIYGRDYRHFRSRDLRMLTSGVEVWPDELGKNS